MRRRRRTIAHACTPNRHTHLRPSHPAMSATQPVCFNFEHSFRKQLPACYLPCQPEVVPNPQLVFWNTALAEEIAPGTEFPPSQQLAAMFGGNLLPVGADPIAQVYAGHQFGHFSPQLGDGRALLLGEIIDHHGQRHDLALKGSGRTPFSRRGDGKAALGPMLREVLIGEALHALGLPTTRALAVVTTGESIRRRHAQPGAVLTRLARSHLRVGTLEYFAARGDVATLKRLADYTIVRHYPHLLDTDTNSRGPYLALLKAIIDQQATLIAQWMGIGFIHGVMNTDNMSLAGESIDFGPCAFMEAYDPATVFSAIDEHGRYAFGNQPDIAQWNLARLAETLLPLLHVDPPEAIELATQAVEDFQAAYRDAYQQVMRAKLGLTTIDAARDSGLMDDWLKLLKEQKLDFTQAWYTLSHAATGDFSPLLRLGGEAETLHAWLQNWQARCAAEDHPHQAPDPRQAAQQRAERLRQTNPAVIPRNHLVEAALDAAEAGDFAPFEQLLEAIRHPFLPAADTFTAPAPSGFTARYQTFCGT